MNETISGLSCLSLKWFFLPKASGIGFRRDVITGFSSVRKDFTPKYFKTVALESGCGSASRWNKTVIALFVTCFPQRKFRHGQNTFLSYPRYSLLYKIKSGDKSCRTCLWDKQDICIHLLVLPFFTRFCSSKLGISFTSIVQVVRASRWEHASIYMSLSFDSWKIQALQALIFQQILS